MKNLYKRSLYASIILLTFLLPWAVFLAYDQHLLKQTYAWNTNHMNETVREKHPIIQRVYDYYYIHDYILSDYNISTIDEQQRMNLPITKLEIALDELVKSATLTPSLLGNVDEQPVSLRFGTLREMMSVQGAIYDLEQFYTASHSLLLQYDDVSEKIINIWLTHPSLDDINMLQVQDIAWKYINYLLGLVILMIGSIAIIDMNLIKLN